MFVEYCHANWLMPAVDEKSELNPTYSVVLVAVPKGHGLNIIVNPAPLVSKLLNSVADPLHHPTLVLDAPFQMRVMPL
jgi:hypothetical protein